MKKVSYQEGDVFCLPLRNSGFCLGVIARISKDRKILLGYFWRDRLASCPLVGQVPVLRPPDAIKIVRFGALSLRNGEWVVVGRIPDWNRIDWPMPKFVRHEDFSKRAFLVTYADNDPSQRVSEERCDRGVNAYEPDSLLGAGYVELMLTQLAGAPATVAT
jgi:hypothetical protein